MNINPWLGLLSYEDPEKSNIQYKFCGRESAISSIFAMIDNNLLVTLYGKTGIGKTSVLNAGVFPLLRSKNYLPVSVRLGKYSNTQVCSFGKCIIDEIKQEISQIGGRIETKFEDYAEKNCFATEFLWRFFYTTSFYNADGEYIYPVITLDQFEEIFISHQEDATLLMKQIYALIDDNREIPIEEGYSDMTNFRFVFSIREDDLFYLEDCIDINHFTEMKQNRYRLCPLSDVEANDVVMLGKDFMEEGKEEEIAIRIVNMSKDNNSHISTNILSLICSQLYIQSAGHFTIESLNTFSANPLESFYEECMKNVSVDTRKFIENNLVEQDRRKFVSKEELKKNVPDDDVKVLVEGKYRILQDVIAGNTECVELIHDSIAKTIYHLKTKMQECETMRRLKRKNNWFKAGMYVLLTIIIAATGVIIYQSQLNQRMQDWSSELRLKSSLSRTSQLDQIHQSYLNQRMQNINKGCLHIVEDAVTRANREYWKLALSVYAVKNSSVDTLILNAPINKSMIDNEQHCYSCDIDVTSANSIRVVMDFGNDNILFHKIDTTFSVFSLTESPSIILPVKRIMPKMYNYSSKVVVNWEDDEIPLQDAVVIIKDEIERTDMNGFFHFNIKDTLTHTDAVSVIRKGIGFYEESGVLTKQGDLIEKIVIVPSDSLIQSFIDECVKKDSITDAKAWTYGNIPPINVKFEDGHIEVMSFYAKIISSENDRYIISGYYYLNSDKGNRPSFGNMKYHSYRFFTGWIDKKDLIKTKAAYKNFEIEAFDFVGNKQKIIGHYTKQGRINGKITTKGNDRIAVLGDYEE